MERIRRISQTFFTFLYNPYLYGFYLGTIYQGRLKLLPCPGLNCHSCPAAIFVCPIGALQLFAAYGRFYVSFFVMGFLGIIGAIGGRIVCGWACPFGFLQELLYKIPAPKLSIPKIVEKLRYVVLIMLVFVIAYYTKEPWFCKIICPAGTIEAGIPLVLLNSDLYQMAGILFVVKLSVLILLLASMLFFKRPFCRTLCPLGALYGLFNRISFFRLEVDKEKCIHCGTCLHVCPVSYDISQDAVSSGRCIRCFKCQKNCPEGAIKIVARTQLTQ